MARNSVENIVMGASQVTLNNSVRVNGYNSYVLSTNFLSWDSINNYKLSDIAPTFGSRRNSMNEEASVDNEPNYFMCGNSYISGFDFGLLYSVFNAMIMARVELGNSFPIEETNTSATGFSALWFGNDCLVYSVDKVVLIPIKNADIKKACNQSEVKLINFAGNDEYRLERQRQMLSIISKDGRLVLTFGMSSCSLQSYAELIKSKDAMVQVSQQIVNTGWDDNSQLGKLITASDSKMELDSVLEKYRSQPVIDSVVSRDDLVCRPSERYVDTTNFFGSICYTDKKEIAVAVNFRSGLFVYYPWFISDVGVERDIKVDPSADFSKFFNITDGCNRILRYAGTVVIRPLTPAQLDINIFSKIKKKVMDMSLPRIPVRSAFGKVVIPEEVLIPELISGQGESLFSLLPVGIVDEKLICLTADSILTAVTPSSWSLSGAFYDITEVARNVEH